MLRLRCLSKFKSSFETPLLCSNGSDKLPLSAVTRALSSLNLNSPQPNKNNICVAIQSLPCAASYSSYSVTSKYFNGRRNAFEGKRSEASSLTLPGGLVQNVREFSGYLLGEGRIKWRRRRAKEMAQRKKVINPSSAVIDQRVPLPHDDMDKLPPGLFGYQEVRDPAKEEREKKDVVAEINRQIVEKSYGRLFAVINLKGKQFKVTTEDIIILQGYWAPNVGDRIRLHKILLAGSSDFTLTGRPLLDSNMIRIEGTVIEKTLSYTKLHFKLLKRKNYRRLKFYKEPYTMLRINMIELLEPMKDVQSDYQDHDQTIDVSFRATSVNK